MLPVKPYVWASLAATAAIVITAAPVCALPLSPGDRVRITIPADDQLAEGDRLNLSGVYEINLDGTLQFPFMDPIPAAGLEISQLEQRLTRSLVSNGFFRADLLQLSAKVLEWAPIQVTVAGEVFEPGRILINSLPIAGDDPRPQRRSQQLLNATGDAPPERYLTAAVRLAGGLKPNADIRHVRLVRNGQEKVLNLEGVFTGESVPDEPLVAGDQVIIPQMEAPQVALVRPSQVTPQNVAILYSNATEPTRRGSQLIEVPYGTRLSQAVVLANCAGGNSITNAKRRVALVQTDRLTGQTRTLETSVERLMKRSGDNADNPFLMPQDGIVCYDAPVATGQGVLRVISDIFTPFFLIQRLFTGNN